MSPGAPAVAVLTAEQLARMLEEAAERGAARALREIVDLPLDTAQAAREAGVSAKTIREWHASGRLRATKAGRNLRIERADLARAMLGDSPDPADAGAATLRALRRAG